MIINVWSSLSNDVINQSNLFQGREIYEKPVNLSCSHAYCHHCLDGLKKEASLDEPSSQSLTIPPPAPNRTLVYKPQLHEPNQCFVCAICRKESMGYYDCRDIEADLKTIESPCPHCEKSLMLCELRKHADNCAASKKKVDANALLKVFSPQFFQQLSQPQAEALQRARGGDNRSTFPCPYCNQQK